MMSLLRRKILLKLLVESGWIQESLLVPVGTLGSQLVERKAANV
jgi:hypothetical protein